MDSSGKLGKLWLVGTKLALEWEKSGLQGEEWNWGLWGEKFGTQGKNNRVKQL